MKYEKKIIREKDKKTTDTILKEINNLYENNLIVSQLGNRGYSIYKICLNDKIIDYIKKELTVKPFTQIQLSETQSFPIYMESDKKIYVPRFWGIKIFGYPKLIKIEYGKSINLTFNGNLREYQKTVLDSYLKAIDFYTPEKKNRGNSSALIELFTGAGKTVLALKILEVIGKKTIIFVHKTFLKNQWIERINQYLPNAKIGTIQGQVIDIENKDIVIAMIQSISMKSYPDSIFNEFGLSIYDECHHISSETFGNCLRKCTTLYGLGLSATMNRKDGLTHVFKMYLGDICNIQSNKEEHDNVLVKAINYNIYGDDEYNETDRDYRGNIKYSSMISKVAKCNYRSDFIVNVMLNEISINNNQQILLLAHQRSLLNYIFKSLEDKNMLDVGYYVGGMKDKDLKISENKKILLATYQMAAEGLDIKTLTTLILATPKSDIIQSVGRILREKHEQPLIIDIVDQHDCFISQFNKRKVFYNEKNYKIIKTDNEKYIEYYNKNNINNINNENIWSEILKREKKSTKKSIDLNEDLSKSPCQCLI